MPSFHTPPARPSTPATTRRAMCVHMLGALVLAVSALGGCDPATPIDEASIESAYADGAMAAVDTGDAGLAWGGADAAAAPGDAGPPFAGDASTGVGGDAGNPTLDGACAPAECGAPPTTAPTCFDGMPAQVLCQRWIDATCRWQLVCGL